MMKTLIIALAFISIFRVCNAQRTYEKNGVDYRELRGGLVRDDNGNVYKVFTCEDGRYLSCYSSQMPFRSWDKKEAMKDVIDTLSYIDFKNSPFSKDKKHAYYTISNSDGHHMRIIKGADAATFKFIENSEYEAEDKFAFYFYKNYSLETLRKDMKYKDVGKGFYLGDNGKMYILTESLIDVHTDKWSKPFYKEVPEVDVKTYKDFSKSYGYSKDKKNVYWRNGTTDGLYFKIVEGADPATFKIDSSVYYMGKDKNGIYESGRRIKTE